MFDHLHQAALVEVKRMNGAIVRLISILEEIDKNQAYLLWGYTSLWNYCFAGLGLSEHQTQQFVSLTRKSKEVPQLKEAIETGKVSFPTAALLVPEITPVNQASWLEKAGSSTTRELKEELAKNNPKAMPKERVTVISDEFLELSMGLKKGTFEKLRRVQDLESQRTKKAAKFADAIDKMADDYMNKYDPELRAKRLLGSSKVKPEKITKGRISLPAWVKHTVHKTYQSQCAESLPNGKRCTERRFLEIHHKVPVSQGGSNLPENLILLCSGHHRGGHLLAKPQGSSRPSASPGHG